jgi:PKD repeat protein
MNRKLILILLTLILSSGVCLADNYVGGIPLTSVKSGTVSGGVYCDSYYGTGTQPIHAAKTIDKTFTLPANAKIEWAMLLTTVYCGHMQNNYQGKAKVSFNGKVLGTETLNVPFVFLVNGGNNGKGYVKVNDHVNRVTSDYMMYYDVTSLVKSGSNKATVHTEPSDNKFDGRIKLITLVVAYNDGSRKKIWYQVNRGHDADTYYVDDNGKTYVGSTAFKAALPAGSTLTSAKLTDIHMASTDGKYTFNGKTLTSGKPQGTYCGLDSWNIKNNFKSTGTNTLKYDRTDAFYKNALAIITAEYKTSSNKPVAAFSASPTSGKAPLTVTFADKSTNNPTSWKWSFGDGTTSTLKNPIHKYSKAGKYTVTLTVTNAAGSNTIKKTSYITVVAKPVAAFSASPISGKVPLTVTFTDKSTGTPSSWKWSFGDGTSSTSKTAVHKYNKAGKYTVSLTVKNAAGSNTKTISSYITVKSK